MSETEKKPTEEVKVEEKKPAAEAPVEKPVEQAEAKPTEKKYISNEDFGKIFTVINGSNTSIPSQAVLSILAGIVKTSGKEAPDIKMFAKACEGLSTEEVVSKSVLFACNSVVLNIWRMFGPEIQQRFNIEMEKLKNLAAEEDKTEGGKA